jgi:flagellum-specific peptidoglycan hydrolase FlgJ
MAQMALETGWGKSELFHKHNNVGGIRSFKPATEAHENYWTWEHVLPSDLVKWDKYERDKAKDERLPNGKVKIRVKLPFRSFPSMVEGLQYYLNNVLLNRYFKNYISEANGDPNKYAELLQSKKYGATYATDSNYIPKIKSLIKEFKA